MAAVLGALLVKTAIIIVAVVLFLGPLRRPYFRNARFTIPATFGGLAGFLLARYVVLQNNMPLPVMNAVLPLAVGFGMAWGTGETAKQWCDRVFGPRERRRE